MVSKRLSDVEHGKVVSEKSRAGKFVSLEGVRPGGLQQPLFWGEVVTAVAVVLVPFRSVPASLKSQGVTLSPEWSD
jgi:hypothetical protein